MYVLYIYYMFNAIAIALARAVDVPIVPTGRFINRQLGHLSVANRTAMHCT